MRKEQISLAAWIRENSRLYVCHFVSSGTLYFSCIHMWQLRVRNSIRRKRVHFWGESGEVYRGTKEAQEEKNTVIVRWSTK